jgi:hypothetical protein
MKFPNAAKGVKKIFTAEILSLIAALLSIVGIAMMIITRAAEESHAENATVVAGLGTIALLAAAAIIILIAGIMSLVGIINASKDDGAFKAALIAILIGVCAAIVSGIFSQNSTVQSICQIVQNLMNIFSTVFVIQGISNLAVKVGNTQVASQAKTILAIIVVIYVLSLIASILVVVFGGQFASVTAGIIAVVALVLDVIAYIVYLSLLSKAKKILA